MQSTFERDSYKLNYVEVEIGPPKQGKDDGTPVIRIQQTSKNVNYSTIVFPPKHNTNSLKSNEKDSTNNNEQVSSPPASKPSQSKIPNVVCTNGPLSLPPAKANISSSPPSSPLPVKSSSPTKKSILAGILPSLPSKFSGVKFSRSKNQAKNNAASNKDASKVLSNSKSSPKKGSSPITINIQSKKIEETPVVSSLETKECLIMNCKPVIMASSPELSPQPRLRKRQSVERRGRSRRQAVADTASCSSSEGLLLTSPETVRKDLLKSRPNTLELNEEDHTNVNQNLSPGPAVQRRRALSTPTRGHQKMLINESELTDAIKSRKERFDSTGEDLAHDDYSSSDDEPFMEIPQAVQAAQKAERDRVFQNQAIQATHNNAKERTHMVQLKQNTGKDRNCKFQAVQNTDKEFICQTIQTAQHCEKEDPSSTENQSKKITYEVVSLGAPLARGKDLTELAKAMKSMQNRVCRRSSVDGYEELEKEDQPIETGQARKIDRHEIEKIIHKSKLSKKLSLSETSCRLGDLQANRDCELSMSATTEMVCNNTVKLKLQRVPSAKSRKFEQEGQRSPKSDSLESKGQDLDGKGHKKPIPLPRSYLNRDSGHESSNDEKSGSSANTSPSSTLCKSRNLNVTPIINIAMEKCQAMREAKQNAEVVIQNGNDTYMNVKLKPRHQRDRYYENVAIEQVLQSISQRSDSPNPSPIPKRRVRHVSGADSEGSSSSEISVSPNQNKVHLSSQYIKQDTSCRYSGGSDCSARGRGDGQNSRPVPAPRYPKESGENHNGKLWYFGKMPRQECENLLLSLAKPCQFLVRDSSHRAGDLMLSVLFGRKVHHYLIQTTQDEKFSIAHHDFNSVTEIIDFYTTHVIMYSPKNDPIYLGEPFMKHQ
ncbi:uncharacterized protein [Antedon mediterranea]|uniref:uncharacterized protein n=1 Tax=Antedon mediterranea TaxID=105859 RepID=UPI003AF91B6D